jgi:hypothetical protein
MEPLHGAVEEVHLFYKALNKLLYLIRLTIDISMTGTRSTSEQNGALVSVRSSD